MAQTEKLNCKLFLVRYVPDAVKNEFINVGLVLLPSAAPAQLRFARDWSRLRNFDPGADIELLQEFAKELQAEIDAQGEQALLLRKAEDWFSNSLQLSESKACLTASPQQEADELARLYLESPRRRVPRSRSARQVIYREMKGEFERAGVWQSMRKQIPAAEYTSLGDPLEIDCGYSPRGQALVKLFHATSLRTDMNAAKALAYSFPAMAAGMERKAKLQAELTAIVEDGLEKDDAKINFAIETLQEQGIRIAALSRLPEIAKLAAREIAGPWQTER